MDFERQVKVLSKASDIGVDLVKYLCSDGDMIPMRLKELLGSTLCAERYNQASKLQHFVWTQVLTIEDKYLLWFEIFNAKDRVRLWNRLVFSENAFTKVAHDERFKRLDLQESLKELRESQIKNLVGGE